MALGSLATLIHQFSFSFGNNKQRTLTLAVTTVFQNFVIVKKYIQVIVSYSFFTLVHYRFTFELLYAYLFSNYICQDAEPNDRKICKLCDYASKNPLRIPKVCNFFLAFSFSLLTYLRCSVFKQRLSLLKMNQLQIQLSESLGLFSGHEIFVCKLYIYAVGQQHTKTPFLFALHDDFDRVT